MQTATRRFFSTKTNIFSDGSISVLNRRSVLAVKGRDAQNLLHNVTATDMKVFEREENRAAVYAAFLSVKGRVLYDGFIAKPKMVEPEFWLDVHEEDMDAVVKNLRRFAMRKHVGIEDISHIIKSYSIQT